MAKVDLQEALDTFCPKEWQEPVKQILAQASGPEPLDADQVAVLEALRHHLIQREKNLYPALDRTLRQEFRALSEWVARACSLAQN